ncbi:hypothetical protein KEM56_007053 [Ascosphaera pollenicola]|nr:hypothetical protein KEM56_007053 [Ascosphaera pollenicola]
MVASKPSSLLLAALESAPTANKALLPISNYDFHRRVMSLWKQWRGSNQIKKPRKIALAISGGADSMALAYLCSQLTAAEFMPGLQVRPLIVDHQARSESTDEAHMVAKWLSDMGFRPEILTLNWPNGLAPSQLSDFESQARKLRYQALGKACRREDIPALFLGHHQDDNIETALLRVSQGHKGLGLRGIPELAHIPECHGIYGVAESGSVLKEADEVAKNHAANRLVYANRGYWHQFLRVADGGICLFRPLLEYPKSRLLATCDDKKVPYVNDKSNFDPTLTPRNAVRHLLATNEVPRALQKPSILNLVEKSRMKASELEALSKDFFKSFVIYKHDAGMGSLMVGFPDLSRSEENSTEIENKVRYNEYAQAMALRNLLDVVAPDPRKTASLEKVGQAAMKIFNPIRTFKDGKLFGRSSFTLGGMKFETVQVGKMGSNNWLLTRQPFKGDTPSPVKDFSIQLPFDRKESRWIDWQLWDDRYWVRCQAVQLDNNEVSPGRTINLHTKETLDLRVRALEETDIMTLRTLLQEPKYQKAGNEDNVLKLKFLNNTLKHRAPGKVRFTLPILCPADDVQNVLGFVTLKKEVPQGFLVKQPNPSKSRANVLRTIWKVRWQVQHKYIDPTFFELPGFH